MSSSQTKLSRRKSVRLHRTGIVMKRITVNKLPWLSRTTVTDVWKGKHHLALTRRIKPLNSDFHNMIQFDYMILLNYYYYLMRLLLLLLLLYNY